MILSDRTIKDYIKQGKLLKTKVPDNQIQPASVDVTLGNHFLLVEDREMSIIEFDKEIKYREIISDSITIPPHSFILATTVEELALPDNISAFVEGRSSVGRMGLFVQNAGWIDPGFTGRITLELYNANSLPILLKAGRRVGQFVFCQTSTDSDRPYQGKYKGQDKTVGSRIFMDKESQKKSKK